MFNENLKIARHLSRLTVKELSEISSVDETAINAYELGIPVDALDKMNLINSMKYNKKFYDSDIYVPYFQDNILIRSYMGASKRFLNVRYSFLETILEKILLVTNSKGIDDELLDFNMINDYSKDDIIDLVRLVYEKLELKENSTIFLENVLEKHGFFLYITEEPRFKILSSSKMATMNDDVYGFIHLNEVPGFNHKIDTIIEELGMILMYKFVDYDELTLEEESKNSMNIMFFKDTFKALCYKNNIKFKKGFTGNYINIITRLAASKGVLSSIIEQLAKKNIYIDENIINDVFNIDYKNDTTDIKDKILKI